MDELDRVLVEAWERVGARLLDRPWELVKRMERVRRAELRRPVRAWAVAVRASDTRIGDGGYSADRPWGDYGCETSEHRASKGYRHRVTLTGARLGELVKPVRVVPGAEALSVKQMAARLGRDARTVNDWLKKGVLMGKKEHDPDRRGGPGWALVTVGAIDPQADGGGRAGGESEPFWGTAWQHHWQRVPAELCQRLVRVPRLRSPRMRRGAMGVDEEGDGFAGGLKPPPPPDKWVGWDWECPGRWVVGASGVWEKVACGRVCKKLWLALPAWHLGKYMAGRGSAGEAAWKRLPRVGAWVGEVDAMGGGGLSGDGGAGGLKPPPPGLACARCLGLRHDGAGGEAWNRFVTVMSGELLYGREVARVESEK